MKLSLAILWSFVLMTDITSALMGGAPNWVSVFCPLSMLVLTYWIDYLYKR